MTAFAHEEVQALLGAYAVHAVDDPAETAAIESHLESCAECLSELDGHREALTLLQPAPALVADSVWEEIAAAIAEPADVSAAIPDEAEEPAGAKVISFPRHRRVAAWLAPVAAAAAAVLITVSVSGGDGGLGTPATNAALEPMSRSAAVAGTVALYEPDTPTGKVVIDLENVPDAPEGHHYEVWVLRPGTEHMEAVGAFTPDEGKARLILRLPGAGKYVAVDISVEENGGPEEHSGTSLARALLT